MLEEAAIPPLRRLALGAAQLDLSDTRGPSPSGTRGPAR
jgi:hypothetical protein